MCASSRRAQIRLQIDSSSTNPEQSHYQEAKCLIEGDLADLCEKYGIEGVRAAGLDFVLAWRAMERQGCFGYEKLVMEEAEDEGPRRELKRMILGIFEWCGSGVAEIFGIEDGLLSVGTNNGTARDSREDARATDRDYKAKWNTGIEDSMEDVVWSRDEIIEDEGDSMEDDNERADFVGRPSFDLSSSQIGKATELEQNNDDMNTDDAELSKLVKQASGNPELDVKQESGELVRDLQMSPKTVSYSAMSGGPEHTTTTERTKTSEKTTYSGRVVTTAYTTTTIRTITVTRLMNATYEPSANKLPLNQKAIAHESNEFFDNFTKEENKWLEEQVRAKKPHWETAKEFNLLFTPCRSHKTIHTKLARLGLDTKTVRVTWPQEQEAYLLDFIKSSRGIREQLEAFNTYSSNQGWPTRTFKALETRLRDLQGPKSAASAWTVEHDEYLWQLLQAKGSSGQHMTAFNAHASQEGWPIRSRGALSKKIAALKPQKVDQQAPAWTSGPKEQEEYPSASLRDDCSLSDLGKSGGSTSSAAWPKAQEVYLIETLQDDCAVDDQLGDFNAHSEVQGWPLRTGNAIKRKLYTLRGPGRHIPNSWPKGQVEYLARNMRDDVPIRVQAEAFNTYSAAQGWPIRTVNALKNKMPQLRVKVSSDN
ncbi:Hypothetical predicted protein [Lecanosticta acicola]|uniref:Uncharacterized protein n=1 Tax=Lecanosticta acicola TaxID=111012 RepID=A0AAI8YVR5_9PEZI|nr:Hypothetical predicted protein [Lecanosticta acicola]